MGGHCKLKLTVPGVLRISEQIIPQIFSCVYQKSFSHFKEEHVIPVDIPKHVDLQNTKPKKDKVIPSRMSFMKKNFYHDIIVFLHLLGYQHKREIQVFTAF